jgi:hypothetical protein
MQQQVEGDPFYALEPARVPAMQWQRRHGLRPRFALRAGAAVYMHLDIGLAPWRADVTSALGAWRIQARGMLGARVRARLTDAVTRESLGEYGDHPDVGVGTRIYETGRIIHGGAQMDWYDLVAGLPLLTRDFVHISLTG